MKDIVKMKKAGDIMIPLESYPHVDEGCTLREAIEEIESARFDIQTPDGRKSLPRVVLVFDRKNQVVGLVRRRDIMRGLEPDFLGSHPIQYRKKLFDVKVDPNLAELSYDRLLKGIKKHAERPVSDVMLEVKETVDYEDHIIKVVYEMVDNNLSLLPVIKDGKVVGVVRSVEAFHEVAKLVL